MLASLPAAIGSITPRAGPAFYAALVSFAVAALATTGAVLAFRSTRRFLANAARATGHVVGWTSSVLRNGGTTSVERVAFRAADGSMYECAGRGSESRGQDSLEGEVVGLVADTLSRRREQLEKHEGQSGYTVLYDPADPKNARIPTFGNLWGLVVFFGLFAAITGVIGVVLVESMLQ